MCSRDEPGRPGNIDDPIKGPIHVNSLDFYTYRWAYSPDSDLQTINDVLIGCFPGTEHTVTELVDDKESEEAEDSTIVVGCPHGTADPLTDIHIIAVVTKYETDVKQDISASWHISCVCVPASKRGSGLLSSFFRFCSLYFPEDRPFDLYSSVKTLNSVNAKTRMDIYRRYGFRVVDKTLVELNSGEWGVFSFKYDIDGYPRYTVRANDKSRTILKSGEGHGKEIIRCTNKEKRTQACLMAVSHYDLRKALTIPRARGGTRRVLRNRRNLRQMSRRRRYV